MRARARWLIPSDLEVALSGARPDLLDEAVRRCVRHTEHMGADALDRGEALVFLRWVGAALDEPGRLGEEALVVQVVQALQHEPLPAPGLSGKLQRIFGRDVQALRPVPPGDAFTEAMEELTGWSGEEARARGCASVLGVMASSGLRTVLALRKLDWGLQECKSNGSDLLSMFNRRALDLFAEAVDDADRDTARYILADSLPTYAAQELAFGLIRYLHGPG